MNGKIKKKKKLKKKYSHEKLKSVRFFLFGFFFSTTFPCLGPNTATGMLS